jgi:acetyl-CoA carboxylase carboxyltransferase component
MRALCERLPGEYKAEFTHPFHAAEPGLIDDVIDPGGTRVKLADALEMPRGKKRGGARIKKHGNPPR